MRYIPVTSYDREAILAVLATVLLVAMMFDAVLRSALRLASTLG